MAIRKRTQSLVQVALALAGAALAVWMVVRIGTDEIGRQLSRAGFELGFLLVAYAAGTIVIAFPWRTLLSPGDRPGLAATAVSRFVASGANAVLPFFGFAGEPLRLLWIAPEARARGIAALVVDRLFFTGAGALLLLVAAMLAPAAGLPIAFAVAGAVTALVMLVILVLAAWSARETRVAWRIYRVVRRLRRRPAQAPPGVREDVDARMQEILRGGQRRLWAVLLVHILGRLLLASELYVALFVLEVQVSPDEALILAAAPIATGIIASSVPSQIGVQEGGVALVAAALGLGPAVGLAVVLLQRVRQVFTVGLAFGLLFARPRRCSDPAR
jgi:uncharacterized protein (TIRG00374 family)